MAYKLVPYITNDYSVGLYSEEADDIYHSAFGALSEAYEKFILPINLSNFLENKKNIKILDICFGIGYNSKAFINEFKSLKLNNINIEIDCVDKDKKLMMISPFIETHINFINRFLNKKILYKNKNIYPEINKITEIGSNIKNKYKISFDTNLILFKNLIKSYGFEILSNELSEILENHEIYPFLSKEMLNFYKFLVKNGILDPQMSKINAFVHNIYYKYISKRYKIWDKLYNNDQIKLNFVEKDIRNHLLNEEKTYDIVFLDGFTPAKCPCIWSVELFNELYKKMNTDSILLTYNSSAPVRSAMIQAKFYVGNTIHNNGKVIGTVATKNELYIKNPLTEKETGLLNTKAGIPYRDINLSQDNDIILINRENEIKSSDLISSSKFLKEWGRKDA